MLKTLAKDTMTYGVGSFIIKFIAFMAFPLYAYAFSVEEFGVMELIVTFAGLIGILLNLGMNNAVQRFYWDPKYKEENRPYIVSSGLWILATWSIFITVLVILLIFPMQNILITKYNIPILLMILALITNIPTQLLQFNLDVLRLHFAPLKFISLSVMKNLTGVLIALWLIFYMNKGLYGYFIGNFVAIFLAVPLGMYFIKKDVRMSIERAHARELVSFGYPFIFAGIAYWIFGSIDRWMIATMTDNTQVGLYSIAFKFSFMLSFLNASFGQAWSPYAIKIYGERSDYKELFSKILSYWFFILIILGSVITIFGTEILRLLTPFTYWPAANILGFLTMGAAVYGTTQITVMGISLERKTTLLSIAAWTTAIINIILNWVMIQFWGALGAAIATWISYGILSGIYLYWTQKLHPIPLEKGRLIYSLLVMGFVLTASTLLNSLEWNLTLVVYKILIILPIILIGYKLKLIPDLKKFINFK